MAISASQVSVTTGGTLLATGQGGGNNKMQVVVRHTSATATYLGASTAVTAGDGYQLAQSVSETFYLKAGDTLYGKTGTSTVTVHVICIF